MALAIFNPSTVYVYSRQGVCLQRVRQHFSKTAWLNPEDDRYWNYTQSIAGIKEIFEEHMFPMSLKGVEDMTRYLAR